MILFFLIPVFNILILFFWLPLIGEAKNHRWAIFVHWIAHIVLPILAIYLIESNGYRLSDPSDSLYAGACIMAGLFVYQLAYLFMILVSFSNNISLKISNDWYVLMIGFLAFIMIVVAPYIVPILNLIFVLFWIALAAHIKKARYKILMHGLIELLAVSTTIVFMPNPMFKQVPALMLPYFILAILQCIHLFVSYRRYQQCIA